MTTIQSSMVTDTELRPLSAAEAYALPALAPAYETLMRMCLVGKTTVAQMIKEGATPVPVIRVGRQLRVRQSDILIFLGLDVAAAIQSAAPAEETQPTHQLPRQSSVNSAENGDGPGVAAPGPSVEHHEIHSSADRK